MLKNWRSRHVASTSATLQLTVKVTTLSFLLYVVFRIFPRGVSPFGSRCLLTYSRPLQRKPVSASEAATAYLFSHPAGRGNFHGFADATLAPSPRYKRPGSLAFERSAGRHNSPRTSVTLAVHHKFTTLAYAHLPLTLLSLCPFSCSEHSLECDQGSPFEDVCALYQLTQPQYQTALRILLPGQVHRVHNVPPSDASLKHCPVI